MNRQTAFISTLSLGLSMSFTWIPFSQAVEIESEFRVGIGESDNIGRTSANEVDETIRNGGMMLNILQESRTLSASLLSDVDYVDYESGTFESEVRGFASLSLDYRIIDDTIRWTLINNYGQQVIDPLASPNPGNRENINFLTTGPSLSLQLGARHGIGADVTYSSLQYEIRPIDNERMNYSVWLARQLNPRARLSLNISRNDIAFDSVPDAGDYAVNEAFVRYATTNTRNTLSLDAGFTEIDIPLLGGTGQLLRLAWTRTISSVSNIAITAGSRFSDNGDIFRFLQFNTPRSTAAVDAPATSEPFRFNYGLLSYTYSGSRTTFGVSAGISEEKFEIQSDENRTITNISFSAGRDISQNAFVDLLVTYNERDFDSISRRDDNVVATLRLGYRIGLHFTIQAEQQFSRRNSSDALRSYEENRTVLRLTYRPRWSL